MDVGISATLRNNRHNEQHLIRGEHDMLKKEHINPILTPLNKVYINRNIEEVYQETFGEAWDNWTGEFANREKKKYKSYYEKVLAQDREATQNQQKGKTYPAKQSSRTAHVCKSLWLQIGSVNERLTIAEAQSWADKMMKYITDNFSKNMVIINASLHIDEDAIGDIDLSPLKNEKGEINIKDITPEQLAQLEYAGVGHLHIDYIPVAYGYENGMAVRNSESKAYEQMGFKVTDQEKKIGFLERSYPTPQKKFLNDLRKQMEGMAQEMGYGIKHTDHAKKVIAHREFKEKQDIKKMTELIHELDERGLSHDDYNKIQAMNRLSGQEAILEAFDNDIDKANEFLMMQNKIMEISQQHEFERERSKQVKEHQDRVKEFFSSKEKGEEK